MIDLDKVDLSSTSDFFPEAICERCAESYFKGSKQHLAKDFNSRLESVGFIPISVPYFKCAWAWKDNAGDEIRAGYREFYLALNFSSFTANLIFYPTKEALVFLQYIDDFKMDVLRAIMIAELNQRINNLQQKENNNEHDDISGLSL